MLTVDELLALRNDAVAVPYLTSAEATGLVDEVAALRRQVAELVARLAVEERTHEQPIESPEKQGV